MANEICIMCGKETDININTRVDMRGPSFIEGAGQLCGKCYLNGASSGREMISIPKHFIKTYSNDFELGEKVRQFYYLEYETPKPENEWVCSLCGGDTSNVDYDYLNGSDHISCILDKEMKS